MVSSEIADLTESLDRHRFFLTFATRNLTEVADRTTQFLSAEPDLNVSHAPPEAPWFEPGARWSVRRVLLHLLAETAQHAGHADLLRETLDGAKTMG